MSSEKVKKTLIEKSDIERLFPKGECAERSKAIVLLAKCVVAATKIVTEQEKRFYNALNRDRGRSEARDSVIEDIKNNFKKSKE